MEVAFKCFGGNIFAYLALFILYYSFFYILDQEYLQREPMRSLPHLLLLSFIICIKIGIKRRMRLSMMKWRKI